ncbi:MAG: hypothetical protein RLZZ299_155 [Pseudomonadota bacterium]|jgi:hypothetical protein
MRLAMMLLLAACTTGTSTTTPTCALEAPLATPAEAAPGETVVLVVRPLTQSRDTVVTVGDARAEGVEVARTECAACDTCRDDSGCRTCGPVCAACVEACAPCVETVRFTVPALPPGPAVVTVRNGLGVSAPGTLGVLESETADSGR